MPRKPTAIAQLKFNVREDLRAKLAREAKRHRFSLNNEMRVRLEASFADKPHGDIAAIAQNLDLIVTQLETAWLRLKATQEVLVLGDLVMSKILEHGERHEWVEELAWPAREWRRLRATVDQPLREPGPGVRLQGENGR